MWAYSLVMWRTYEMTQPKTENDFDPTRRQLEDLQALLDRMLQIPVLQPGDVPDSVLPPQRPKSLSLLVPAGSHQIDPGPVSPAIPIQLPGTPSGPPNSVKPTAEPIVVAPASAQVTPHAVATKPEPLRSIVVATVPSPPTHLPPIVQSDSEPVPRAPISLSTPPARPAVRSRFDVAPPQSLALAPLRSINWCFETAVLPLGASGRWLKSRAGRNALGWIGVLLVLIAAGWGTTEATMRWITPSGTAIVKQPTP
jgi:hypothetical protein